ncbi:hypothetical protein O181_082786 [Austropuccinia psidii MF-1]|uniref:Retrotransposon gag domain-containing protein n=1 Tax=Austropuccinia psidii MF-1 TaxID=1389203 RepID=A0A9Q3IHA9_9BASI|nr:hypothetical protein [Austropuccinia psidii MF-1]
MDFTLELDTRYHERQKEKGHDQEKRPEASKSNSSHHQNSSSSSQKKKNNSHSQKRDKPHSSLLNKDFKLLGSEKERRIKEGLCTYCGGKNSLESCFKRPQNQLTQPSVQLCILNTCVNNSLKFFVFSSLSDVFYSILNDSGATNSFIAKKFLHKYYLTISELPEKIPFIILDSSESPSFLLNHNTKFMSQGIFTFNADHQDYYDPSNVFGNDFSSAQSCAAMVGDSRTPSFPSSVHIPSPNSHQ